VVVTGALLCGWRPHFRRHENKDGKVETWGPPQLQPISQDQVPTLNAGQQEGRRRSGVGIWDRGAYPIMEAFEASQRIGKLPPTNQEAAWKSFQASRPGDAENGLSSAASEA